MGGFFKPMLISMVNWATLPARLAEPALAEPALVAWAAAAAAAAAVSLLEETRFLPLVPCSDISFSFPDQVSDETKFYPRTIPLLYLFCPSKKTQTLIFCRKQDLENAVLSVKNVSKRKKTAHQKCNGFLAQEGEREKREFRQLVRVRTHNEIGEKNSSFFECYVFFRMSSFRTPNFRTSLYRISNKIHIFEPTNF
jgi:hypothetical protein